MRTELEVKERTELDPGLMRPRAFTTSAESGEKSNVSTHLAAGAVPRVPGVSVPERGADDLIGSGPVLRPGWWHGRCDSASHGEACGREKTPVFSGSGELVREVNGVRKPPTSSQ